jgi:hypothetical protein
VVVRSIRSSIKRVRKFLNRLGLSVGKCFDEHELVSLLKSVNVKGDGFWLLGWREHGALGNLSTINVILIDRDDREYVIKLLVSVSAVNVTLPVKLLNLSDDVAGVTIMLDNDLAHISGRILCVRGIEISEVS